MKVAGIDPSNGYTGIAAARPAAQLRDRLLEARAVRLFEEDAYCVRSIRERIAPVLDQWIADDLLLAIEQAPPTAREDMGHGAQAEIGYAQGWLGGMICGRYADTARIERFGPSPWRDTMIVEAARNGLLLQKPTRASLTSAQGGAAVTRVLRVDRAPQGGFNVLWRGCAHVFWCLNMGAVQAKPDRCPECAKGDKPRPAVGADIRDAWKALACRFVAHFWPEIYEGIVAPARERAHTNPPDHRLAGVPDACEAVGIALHGLTLVRGGA